MSAEIGVRRLPALSPSRAVALFVAMAWRRRTRSRCRRRRPQQRADRVRRRLPSRTPSAVQLLVGRSTVLDVGAPITRVSLTSPDVADALVTSPQPAAGPRQGAGHDLDVRLGSQRRASRRYEVVVQRDLASCSEQMKQLFPGEEIAVTSNGKDVVLSGTVSSKDVDGQGRRTWPRATSTRTKTSSTCCSMQDGAATQSGAAARALRGSEPSALTELGASRWLPTASTMPTVRAADDAAVRRASAIGDEARASSSSATS